MSEYICSRCNNSFSCNADDADRITCPYCGEELALDNASDILPEGFRINGFRIIRLLASGGCGRVYLADQVAMERQVAIKILKQSLADQEDAAERFINEARNAAKFQYPNIVTTLEAGKVNGLYYIAMQYVNGETVEKQLDDGKIFSESEALSIVLKIAGALQLIWNKHRMFHKDIKPANIMLDSDNEAMLLDMGIAQQAGEESLINGEVEGSPFYMSPEQIQGKTLTWSTDLYSLGATLYHMVTGCVPFYDKSIDQILEMHNNAPYPEPSERAPGSDISPELSGLMKRMLGKTPRKRFSSWEEFLQAASVIYEERQAEEQAFLHPPIKLTPVITASQPLPGRPMKKHWVLLFYGFILILFVLILAALFIWHNNRLAAQALENCRFDPYTTNPQEYKKALDQVYLTAQKFGVRARIRREVDDAYARLKQFENEFLTLQAKVNQALNRAEKLKAQAQKETALGKKLVEQKHSDDNHYTRARKLLNQAAIHLNGITTKDPRLQSVINERIKLNEEEIQKIKALEKERDTYAARLRKEREARIAEQKRRQAEAARLRQQEELRKKQLAEENRKKQTTLKSYQERLEKYKNELRSVIVEAVLTQNFDSWAEKLVSPEGLNEAADYKAATTAFLNWYQAMKIFAEEMKSAHGLIYDSRRDYVGFPLMSPITGKKMKVGRIKKDYILLYMEGMMSENLPFSRFHSPELLSLERYASKKKKRKFSVPAFFASFGRWKDAKQTASNGFEKTEIEFMINIYFSNAVKDAARKWHNGSKEEARRLLAAYGTMPEFAKFKEELQQNIKNSAGKSSPAEQKQKTTKGKK